MSLENRLAAWRDKGLNVDWTDVLVTAKDGQNEPNIEAARYWIQKHNFTHVSVTGDGNYYKLLKPGTSSFGTPTFLVIDPRTMKVALYQEGLTQSGAEHKLIESLAQKNHDADVAAGTAP